MNMREMNKHHLAGLVFGFSLMGMAAPSSATTLSGTFNFESADLSGWSQVGGTALPVIVSSGAHGGNYAAQLIGGVTQNSFLWFDFGGVVSSASVEAYVNITQWDQALADFSLQFTNPALAPRHDLGSIWAWGENGGYYLSKDQPWPPGFFNPAIPMGQYNMVNVTYDSGNGETVKFFSNGVERLSLSDYGTDVGGFALGASGCCGQITYLVDDISYQAELTSAVPEPTSLYLFGAGLVVFASVGRKKHLTRNTRGVGSPPAQSIPSY